MFGGGPRDPRRGTNIRTAPLRQRKKRRDSPGRGRPRAERGDEFEREKGGTRGKEGETRRFPVQYGFCRRTDQITRTGWARKRGTNDLKGQRLRFVTHNASYRPHALGTLSPMQKGEAASRVSSKSALGTGRASRLNKAWRSGETCVRGETVDEDCIKALGSSARTAGSWHGPGPKCVSVSRMPFEGPVATSYRGRGIVGWKGRARGG